MILSDKTIKDYLGTVIKVEPIEDYQIQPASIDLRLGQDLLFPVSSGQCYNFRDKIEYKKRSIDEIIPPNHFVLGSTIERIKLPKNISAFVSGRSTIGRAGLIVETAGFVDPNFEGNITLELFNCTNVPMKLYYGMRICQIIFFETEEVSIGYGKRNNKYQYQSGVTGSKIHEE